MSGLSDQARELIRIAVGRSREMGSDTVIHTVENLLAAHVNAALTAAADEMEAVAAEHLAQDEAEKCKARYCQGWRRGQQHAARIVRARIT